MPSASQEPRISPELDLVLLCLKARLDEADERRIRGMAGEALDWEEVTALVPSHQVLPAFYRGLQQAVPDCIPAAVRSDFEFRIRNIAKKNMLLFAELLRLLAAFEAEGVLLIPYKGIVQGWLAYHDLAMRACLDLDFALRQRDIPRAIELLKAQGFESGLPPQHLQLAERGQFPGQYAFQRGDKELQVEFHTEKTLRYFPVPLDFDILERRLQTLKIGGRAMRTFSREDTIVFLCVHGAKHFWARLNWICDVGRLAGADPAPDWAKLEATAAEMQCARNVLLGLLLAHEMLGARIPDAVLSRARRDRNVARLARQVREQIARKEQSPHGVLQRALFRVRCSDRLGDGMRHVWRLTTRSTERDWGDAADRTSFSSALARARRLVRQYGWRREN